MNTREMSTSLSEKETLLDLLTTQKGLIAAYTQGIMEADSEAVRESMSCNLTESFRDQYGIFKNMSNRGYYPLQMADASAVQQACLQYEQIARQL